LNIHTYLLLNDISKLYLSKMTMTGFEFLPQNAANAADFTPSETGLFYRFLAVEMAIPTF
tara:strand:+ start:478 stop:657 length:180 start_codon:yes stop_codon:yes gene_type:complete